MRRSKTAWLFFLFICLSQQTGFSQPGDEFIRKQGSQLVVGADEKSIFLRGVNLIFDRIVLPDGRWTIGTCEILNQYPSTTPVTNWYSERHLQSIAEIGFNVIRMNLHYRIFEDDSNPGVYKQSGWDFLDTYIQWATDQNLFTINCCPTGVVCCSGENETTSAYPALIDLFTGYFDSLSTSVGDNGGGTPATFVLQQNYPNPFSAKGRRTFGTPVTAIRYLLTAVSEVGWRFTT